ncbi:hypothetical protein [Ferruginibacter sp.]
MEENKEIREEQPAENISAAGSGGEVEQSNIPPLSGTAIIETINTAKEKDMEVHHHTHAAHGKKNWKAYFWEFLMLFLAVFCGFLAEYQLEHKIERDREKVYMQNMLEDLKADTAIYADYLARNAVVRDLLDTITVLIKRPDRKKYISKLAYSARILTAKWKQIAMVKRTYEDMKSSGHLRLIRNKEVSGKVSSYYNSLSELDTYNNVGMIWANNYAQAMAKLFDGEDLLKIIKEKKEIPLTADAMISEDKIAMNELLTSAGYFYGALSLNNIVAANRNQDAKKLIELLQKAYHLE